MICVYCFFFPLNTVITYLSWYVRPFPRSLLRDWSLDPCLAPGADWTKSKCATSNVSFSEQNSGDVKYRLVSKPRSGFKEEELMKIFDELPSPTQEQMLNHWRGRIIRSGSWLDWIDYCFVVCNMLGLQWGKRYRSPYCGDPLVFNLWDYIFFPCPIWGNVSIPEVRYRKKTNVVMAYDCQPWHDHFRILQVGQDDEPVVLLGFWATREKICGWFTLSRMPEIDKAVGHMHRLNAPDTYSDNYGSDL